MVASTDAFRQEASRRPLGAVNGRQVLGLNADEKKQNTGKDDAARLAEREKAVAALEQKAWDLSREQEERRQDLEVLDMRLREREEAFSERETEYNKGIAMQDKASKEIEARLAKLEAAESELQRKEQVIAEQMSRAEQAQHARKESENAAAAVELQLSDRAGRLATREKRVAEDEGAIRARERDCSERQAALDEREKRLDAREAKIQEANASAARDLARRVCQAEHREMHLADLEASLLQRQKDVASTEDETKSTAAVPSESRNLQCQKRHQQGLQEPEELQSHGQGGSSSSTSAPRLGSNALGQSRANTLPGSAATKNSEKPMASKSFAFAPPASRGRTLEEFPSSPESAEEETSVEFRDAEGNNVAFKLNSSGGVDYYINGRKEVCNVDCYARGRTLHTAGSSTGKWSPSRQTTVPEGKEAIVQQVLALFHRRSSEAISQMRASRLPRTMPASWGIGPGEELTLTLSPNFASAAQLLENGGYSKEALSQRHNLGDAGGHNSKVVRFTEIQEARRSEEEEEEPPLRPRSLDFAAEAAETNLRSVTPVLQRQDAVDSNSAPVADAVVAGGGRTRRLTARKRIGATSTDQHQRLQTQPEAEPDAAGTDREDVNQQGGLSGGLSRLASAVKRRVSLAR
eukprot:TRINITY_DN20959_c0_g1_i1.p1 TRINITY_DN20959_c0_g1~~TRINITY_DN20959_c0_g1_i1.p1  ORF type:complete len:637 (+),score=170.45 TRINITY_DN20959_c0_g1_i1:39-1949(+)